MQNVCFLYDAVGAHLLRPLAQLVMAYDGGLLHAPVRYILNSQTREIELVEAEDERTFLAHVVRTNWSCAAYRIERNMGILRVPAQLAVVQQWSVDQLSTLVVNMQPTHRTHGVLTGRLERISFARAEPVADS